MLASACAAALSALAITVAVPALADDPAGDKGPDGLAACLRDHGLTGAPDGDGLKPWLGPRLERGDATAQRALETCAPKPTVVEAPGPDVQEVRSCLKEHGVAIPAGDGATLKRWLLAHGDEAANRDALKACHIALPGTSGDDGPCGGGKERGVLGIVRKHSGDAPMPGVPRPVGERETSGAN
jgi:hypothetical protein